MLQPSPYVDLFDMVVQGSEVALPSPEVPLEIDLPDGVRESLLLREGRTRLDFRALQSRLLTHFADLKNRLTRLVTVSQWRPLKAWIFQLLGLPPGVKGVEMNFALGVFTYVYVLRLLDVEDDACERLNLWQLHALRTHYATGQQHASSQFNPFPDCDDILDYSCSFFPTAEDDTYQEVGLVPDLHPSPLSSPTSSASALGSPISVDSSPSDFNALTPEELAVLLLPDTKAPLVEQMARLTQIMVSILHGISTTRFQSRKERYTPEDLKRALGTLPKGRESFLEPRESVTRAVERGLLGHVIQHLKTIDPCNYTHKEMISALRVVQPSYISCLQEDHQEALLRFGRLQDTLLSQLYSWAPNAEEWEADVYLFRSRLLIGKERKGYLECSRTGAAKFIKLLLDRPQFLPRLAVPDVTFLFLSQDNFLRSWRWLGPAIQNAGICVHAIGQSLEITKQFYSILREVLHGQTLHKTTVGRWQQLVKDFGNVTATILLRTAEFHRWSRHQNKHLHQNKLTEKHLADFRARASLGEMPTHPQFISCHHCYLLPAEQQCSQMLFTEKRYNVEKLRGQGISMDQDLLDHPPSGTTVYHPDDLQLKCLDAPEEILRRCGRFIWLISDDKESDPLHPLPSDMAPSPTAPTPTVRLTKTQKKALKRRLKQEQSSSKEDPEIETPLPPPLLLSPPLLPSPPPLPSSSSPPAFTSANLTSSEASQASPSSDKYYIPIHALPQTASLELRLIGCRRIVNWAMYNAFSKDVHKRVADHEELSSYMCELKRGSQFQNFTAKKSGMYAAGARQPKGGAPGDAYGFYADFEVESLEGIHRAFDFAEDGMFLMLVAGFVCSSMAQRMKQDVEAADRLGISGHNIFRCDGYCAPQHTDDDEGWSLCCQIRWSFNSRDMHGTMLPGKGSFPPPEEFMDPMGTSRRPRNNPVNPVSLARDRGNRPGWPMQIFHDQDRARREQEQRPPQNPPDQNAGGGARVRGGGRPRHDGTFWQRDVSIALFERVIQTSGTGMSKSTLTSRKPLLCLGGNNTTTTQPGGDRGHCCAVNSSPARSQAETSSPVRKVSRFKEKYQENPNTTQSTALRAKLAERRAAERGHRDAKSAKEVLSASEEREQRRCRMMAKARMSARREVRQRNGCTNTMMTPEEW
ncbi:hypothetical protein BDZ89DRAFT_1037165 [Hymenopellis radicata]|nr:hypothetical protein BDZ89DRAFT_1037165 [Hymenopellis radicata]